MLDRNDTTLLGAYGILRNGMGGWSWALRGAELVRTDTVSGYQMRTHGAFPAIFYTGQVEDKVVVDVFDVATHPDPDHAMESMDSMEFGVGYFRRRVDTDGGLKAWVYVMPDDHMNRFPEPVDDGDWVQYCYGDSQ